MILQDGALRDWMRRDRPIDERLCITPLLSEDQIGPASVDLRLGSKFISLRRPETSGIDPVADQTGPAQSTMHVRFGNAMWLQPQQFVLGATLEFVRLPPNLAAFVVGRSSWGRLGLVVATAIMVQPGFAGSLTLELANEGDTPIRLYPGLRVAQLVLLATQGMAEHSYNPLTSTYSFPTGPEYPRAAWRQDELEAIDHMSQTLGKV